MWLNFQSQDHLNSSVSETEMASTFALDLATFPRTSRKENSKLIHLLSQTTTTERILVIFHVNRWNDDVQLLYTTKSFLNCLGEAASKLVVCDNGYRIKLSAFSIFDGNEKSGQN